MCYNSGKRLPNQWESTHKGGESKHIDYTGTDVDCPDGTITAEDKKKIFEYLHEHYGYPPFNKKDVENKLKEYNGIHL